ncbi:O-methyltransferase [Bizionia sediminis]|uniref:O-methyltransferase n=1 Tax=Bizionia sediminis TaxID=1737064 RepID=A0ABW5KQ09_9FLAO
MLYQIKKYIQFLLKSSNQHGVHSPFVYQLVTHCFYNRQPYTDYNSLKTYRAALIKNQTALQVTDLGMGSKKNKTTQRQVSELAKTAGSTLKRAKLAYRISHYFKPQQILELGSSLGIATQAFHLGHPAAKITTVEGCPNIAAFTKNNLSNYTNISCKTGAFKTFLNAENKTTWDIVFFDGHHNKDATLAYFQALLPQTHNDTLFIFDDIYWSPNMTDAWETIKKHPKVTVTIDIFFWGLVFFRQEQVKQHFTIRV